MSEQKKTVVIIGAGPAGLAAAYKAQKVGYRVVVLEKNDFAGGKGGSRKWKNFIVDFGPHIYHAISKEITDLVIEHGGGEMTDVTPVQRLYITEKPMGFPFSLKEAVVKFGLWLNICILWDYMYVKIKSFFVKLPQKSFKQYGIANFGRTLYDICFGLYSERVWSCSADKLSAEFARRKLPSVSLGAFLLQILFGGQAKENKKSYLYVRRYMYHRHGIGKVYENMADGIQARGGEVFYNVAIKSIDNSGGRINKIVLDAPYATEIAVDWMVSTIPFDDLLAYFSSPVVSMQGISEHLPFRHGIIVNTVINRKKFDDAHWIYLVNKRFYFNRMSEPKNFSSLSAPEDQTLLMLEKMCLPEDPVWKWGATEWRPKVEADLRFFGVKPEEIGEIFVTRIEKAFPFYVVDYEPKKRQMLGELAKFKNLVTTGRYGLYLEINMHDAMVLGMEGFQHLVDGRLNEFYEDHTEIALKNRKV